MKTSQYIDSISKEYSRYVLVSRAIPMLTDGLKTSQRIALYLMQDQTKSVKTAALVGKAMGSGLYSHGDAAMGNAISYLAGPYINNHPLLQGEGAFGSRVDPTAFGAPRYTEVKRAKFAEKELYLDTNICPHIENYDGSTTMPLTFMPLLPLVLLNGIRGIAVGFACNILPRSLEELRGAVNDVLETGVTKRPLMPVYEQYDCDILRDHTNQNKYHIRGKLHIVNSTTVQITEIPPSMGINNVVERLISLEDDKKITSFTDSTSDKVAITVRMARAELKKYTEGGLINLFKISQPETENITVLDPSGTRVIKYDNPQDLIKDFVKWRLDCYKDRYEYLLKIENESALFWKSFLACFEGAGGGKRSVAASISGIQTRSDLVTMVEQAIAFQNLDVGKDIVDRIVALPVYRFTKEGQARGKTNLREAEKLIKEYTGILGSPAKRKKIYKQEINH
jgi:DNA gyrase/topoisomerase IV subunit A